jgi:hypothetical protein
MRRVLPRLLQEKKGINLAKYNRNRKGHAYAMHVLRGASLSVSESKKEGIDTGGSLIHDKPLYLKERGVRRDGRKHLQIHVP